MRESKRLNRLKVVFVDWHKTLCSCPFFHHLEKKDTALYEKLDHRLFEEMPVEDFIEWMRGNISKDEIVKRLAGNDLSCSEIAALLKQGCETMSLDRKDYLKWIKKIRKKGKKAVIATDNVDTFDDYTVPALRLNRYFDDILSSFQLKKLKKDAEGKKLLFFDDFLKKNGIKYEEAMLIDDDEKTIKLCRRCGMQGKVVKSPEDVLKILMMIEASCDRCEY